MQREVRRLSVESLEGRQLLTQFTPTLLADFSPGDASSTFSNFIPTDDRLYFNVNDREFWSTDGTPAGTVYLADVRVNALQTQTNGAELEPTTLPDGSLLFEADGIWRTDGTAAGTQRLIAEGEIKHDLIHGDGFSIAQLRVDSGREIWRIEHGGGGQAVLIGSQPSYFQPRPEILVAGDDVFIAHLGTEGSLIRSRGANAEITLLGDGVEQAPVLSGAGVFFVATRDEQTQLFRIAPGADGVTPVVAFTESVYGLRGFEDRVAFFVELPDQEIAPEPQLEMWFSDGTEVGTVAVPDLLTYHPYWLPDLNGVALFMPGPSHLSGLYRSDGTVEGSYQLTAGAWLGALEGRVYTEALSAFTDGTSVFTALPETIPTDGQPPPRAAFYRFGDGYVRTANPWNHGFDPANFFVPNEDGVLRSSGSFWEHELQTARVEDHVFVIGHADVSGTPRVLADLEVPTVHLISVVLNNRGDARELSFLDTEKPTAAPQYFEFGRPGATTIWSITKDGNVEEIGPFEAWSERQTDTGFFFTRQTQASGNELWVSNGTTEGTVEVDLWPGSGSSSPTLVDWSRARIVSAASPDTGNELWVVDGSFAETPYEGMEATVGRFVTSPGEAFELSAEVDAPIDLGELQFSWDLNDDGVFGDFDGQSGTVAWAQILSLDPPLTLNQDTPVRVRITGDGVDHLESGVLRVSDRGDVRPPTVTDVRVGVDEGRLASLEVDFSEPVTMREVEIRVRGSRDLRTTDVDWNEERTTFHLEVTRTEIGVGDHSFLLWDVIDDGGNPIDGNVEGYFFGRILVTRPGDLNQDFSVDFFDFLVFARKFGRRDAGQLDGDLNLDGVVDFSDFLILSRDFGKS